MWPYWKLGTLRPQAELQGPGGGLPPDMQYAGPLVSGICPGAHEQTNKTTPTTSQGHMQARPPSVWHKYKDSWEVAGTDRDSWRHTVR